MLDSLEPSDDVDLLRELGARAPAGAWQAVHGDCHLANCMPGPLWHDFETACRGPREFDLAALALWKDARTAGPLSSRTATTTGTCSSSASRSTPPGFTRRDSSRCTSARRKRRS